MSQKPFDVVVYIGRFQPVHRGHIETLKNAASLAKRVVVILGSAEKPRSYKNPFFYGERVAMLQNVLSEYRIPDTYDTAFSFAPNIDTIYDDAAWLSRVQKIVAQYSYKGDKIAIIGHKKDDSSEYIDWFPQWEKIDQELVDPLDATQIRDLYFREDANLNFIASVVSPNTLAFMNGFRNGKEFRQVVKEREFLDEQKKIYQHLPYPPTFNTADAVVLQAGHILLIKRRSEPGKGLWAFPGGYIQANKDKTLQDTMIRELREETGLKLSERTLIRAIQKVKTFDHISRSERGRIITEAFFIALDDGEWNLPKVKGLDDAEKAVWVPISQVKSEEMFEDHFDVFKYFIPGA